MDGYSACSQAIGGKYYILSFSTIAAQMGPAVLVSQDSRLLQLWLRVVETLPSTVDKELLFPSFDGKPLGHLEWVVGWAAAKHGHTLPNATSFRKELENTNQRRLSGAVKEVVSRSLCHSSDTAAKYYQAPLMGDCLHTFSTIQCLIGDGDVSRSPSPAGEGRREESMSPTSQRRGKSKGRRAGGLGDWEETAGGSGDWEGMGDDAVGGSGDREGMGEKGVSEGGSDIVVLSNHFCESSEHGVVAAKSEKSLPHKTCRNSF